MDAYRQKKLGQRQSEVAKGLEADSLGRERADCSLQKVERGAVPGIGQFGIG
jgi:hypothetical protein